MKYLILLILGSTGAEARTCHQLFTTYNSESSAQEIYISDLKNGSPLDSRYKKRFDAIKERTIQPKMSLQNYPMPQLKSVVESLLKSLTDLEKDMKENPSEYDVYNNPSYGWYFLTTIKNGKKILSQGKFMSHETLLFIDRAVSLSMIIRKSYLTPHLEVHASDHVEYASRAKFWIDEVFYGNDHFRDSLRSPLALYSAPRGTHYTTFALHPAILRPSFDF